MTLAPARPASPECPVCMEEMAPPTRIFQCGTGHLLCGVCRPKIRVGKAPPDHRTTWPQECPSKCGQPLVGRATGIEQYLRDLHGLCGARPGLHSR
jgi:hypothetical protein